MKPTPIARAVLLLGLAALTATAQDTEPGRPLVALLGLHGGVAERLRPALESVGLDACDLNEEGLLVDAAPLRRTGVVILQTLRGERAAAMQRVFDAAKAANPAIRFLTVSAPAAAQGSGAPSSSRPTTRRSIVESDPTLSAYYAGATEENLRRMAAYVARSYFGRPVDVQPPAPRTTVGLWHPDHDGFFADAPAFESWSASRRLTGASPPRVAVVVHGLHLEFQEPEVIRALIRSLEARGAVAAAIVDTAEGLASMRETYEANILGFAPDVVVHTCHATDTVSLREKLDVAHVHSIFFTRDSIDEWRKNPVGLDPHTVAFQILTQEIIGGIEPLIGGGTRHGHGSGDAVVPIPDRIEHVTARAMRWATLHRKPNAKKRVALLYYDRELDPAALMRGSTTGMFMNAPRSVVALLRRLAHEGYAVDPMPRDDSELISWMQRGGRQVGMWAKETLAREVRDGNPVLIPVATYARWLNEDLPAERRAEILARWGPPPGEIMTWTDARGSFIVVPRIDLGGISLLPQPLRGEAQDPRLLHDQSVPPPHNYLATYLWLRRELAADALIHFGTHGSEFFLPGKRAGLASDDWCEILLGDLPNICPWIVSNLGEVGPAKRRTNAVIVSHATPPVVEAGLTDAVQNLHQDLEKFLGLEAGALKEGFRKSISEAARAQRLTTDLHVPPGDGLLDDETLKRLDTYLHELREERTPTSLHVLGTSPSDDVLAAYVVSCLKRAYLDALEPLLPKAGGHESGALAPNVQKAAVQVVDGVIRRGLDAAAALKAAGIDHDGPIPERLARSLELAKDLASRLSRASEEIDGIVAALSGRFVRPGPGGSPVRNPASAPGGRNLFLVNPEEIPARASFDLGRRLLEDFLREYRARTGHHPTRIAFSLAASSTFQDYGVLESQVLAALGCEPIWDEKNVVSDVRVIPRPELGRPRIDVFLSGQPFYRDTMLSRMTLLDRAVRKVADLDEAENFVRKETARIESDLAERGVDPTRAKVLARARLFGGSPDGTNAGFSYFVEKSGGWDSRQDVAKAYIDGVRFAYTDGAFGVESPEAFEAVLKTTDVVMRTWTDPVRSPLTDKYGWLRGGALALAVKQLSGREPEFVLSDVRDADAARTISAEDAIAADFRVRLFNRKWIEGMMREGYAGADQMSNATSNAFGWATMREGAIRADAWEELKKIYVDDSLGLHIREFFEKENPHAFRETLEILLEAVNKGYWNASAEVTADLARAHRESVARHGESNGLRSAGNDKLDAFIARHAGAPGKNPAPTTAAPSPTASGAHAPPSAQPARPIVSGPKLVTAPSPPPRSESARPPGDSDGSPNPSLVVAGVAIVLLFVAGFLLGRH